MFIHLPSIAAIYSTEDFSFVDINVSMETSLTVNIPENSGQIFTVSTARKAIANIYLNFKDAKKQPPVLIDSETINLGVSTEDAGLSSVIAAMSEDDRSKMLTRFISHLNYLRKSENHAEMLRRHEEQPFAGLADDGMGVAPAKPSWLMAGPHTEKDIVQYNLRIKNIKRAFEDTVEIHNDLTFTAAQSYVEDAALWLPLNEKLRQIQDRLNG